MDADGQESAPPAPPSAGVEDEMDQMQISTELTEEEQEARLQAEQAERRAKALDDAVFNDDDEGPVFINPEDMQRMMDFGPDDEPPPPDDEDGGMHDGVDATGAESEAIADAEELVMRFEEHTAPVYALATHPTDASLVLSGGGDDCGMLWNARTGEVCARLGASAGVGVCARVCAGVTG